MAQITFNQEHKLTIKEGTTLSEFLKEQHLLKEGVAVAIDEDIIKKDTYDNVILKDGMNVDVYNMVSGG